MQTAVERYRAGKVIPPADPGQLHVDEPVGAKHQPDDGQYRGDAAGIHHVGPMIDLFAGASLSHGHQPIRSIGEPGARVVVITADEAFAESVRATFGAGRKSASMSSPATLPSAPTAIDLAGATVVVVDLDAGDEAELQALER